MIKKLLSTLCLLILSSSCFAAPGLPPSVPSLTVGGRVFTDLKNLIILHGGGTVGANNYQTLRKADGSAGYTPSGTKTFKIHAVAGFNTSTTGGMTLQVGYADNDVGFTPTTTVPTNAKFIAGNTAVGATSMVGIFPNSSTNPSGTEYQFAFDFTVPNGKYPFIYLPNGADCRFKIFGYEE